MTPPEVLLARSFRFDAVAVARLLVAARSQLAELHALFRNDDPDTALAELKQLAGDQAIDLQVKWAVRQIKFYRELSERGMRLNEKT